MDKDGSNEPLHNRTVEHLGRGVVTGRLTTGTTFRIEDVAAELSVSRSVAREAVRALECTRLLTSRRHVGVSVRPRSDWCFLDARVLRWSAEFDPHRVEHLDVLLMAVGMTPQAARYATANGSPAELHRLVSAVLRTESPAEFLVCLFGAAHTPVFDQLGELAAAMRVPASECLQWPRRAVALAVALSEHEGENARDAMELVAVSWAAQLRVRDVDRLISVVP